MPRDGTTSNGLSGAFVAVEGFKGYISKEFRVLQWRKNRGFGRAQTWSNMRDWYTQKGKNYIITTLLLLKMVLQATDSWGYLVSSSTEVGGTWCWNTMQLNDFSMILWGKKINKVLLTFEYDYFVTSAKSKINENVIKDRKEKRGAKTGDRNRPTWQPAEHLHLKWLNQEQLLFPTLNILMNTLL